MSPEELKTYVADGGQQMIAVPELEVRQVDPDKIAVDEMNERQNEPLATEDLEDSIAENGVVEPPVCRVRDADARMPYSVIQGQRRVAAAQTVGVDTIPILVGEFDDKTALVRSITENVKSNRKEVTTESRAAAIWQLWKIVVEEDDEMELEEFKYPRPTEISNLLGVNTMTASNWIEPLRSEFSGSKIDPRERFNNDNIKSFNLSENIADMSPEKLRIIRTQISGGGDDAAEIAERVQQEDLSIDDVKKVAEVEAEDTEEAIQAVKQAKRAAEKTEGYVLEQYQFGSTTSEGLAKASRNMGATREQVIQTAVKNFLREEGFI
jgi:ParB/RepB/Spo0J family partition protein